MGTLAATQRREAEGKKTESTWFWGEMDIVNADGAKVGPISALINDGKRQLGIACSWDNQGNMSPTGLPIWTNIGNTKSLIGLSKRAPLVGHHQIVKSVVVIGENIPRVEEKVKTY
jgi:hypothetical protein